MKRLLPLVVVLGLALAPTSSGPLAKNKLVKTWKNKALTLYLYKDSSKNTLIFRASNKGWQDLDLRMDFTVKNIQVSPSIKPRVLLRPRQKSRLVAKLKLPTQKSYSYKFKYVFYYGDPQAQNKGTYQLPFAPGKKFRVDNAFHGWGMHKGHMAHAVDFYMPVGTPIYAARSGRVIRVVEKQNQGGPHKKYEKYANLIHIRHQDGTLARYLHLKQNGALVKVGQTVKRGQKIGLSGNTGFSTGPHLHFDVVRANGKGGLDTLPWKFKIEKKLIEPKKGMKLSH